MRSSACLELGRRSLPCSASLTRRRHSCGRRVNSGNFERFRNTGIAELLCLRRHDSAMPPTRIALPWQGRSVRRRWEDFFSFGKEYTILFDSVWSWRSKRTPLQSMQRPPRGRSGFVLWQYCDASGMSVRPSTACTKPTGAFRRGSGVLVFAGLARHVSFAQIQSCVAGHGASASLEGERLDICSYMLLCSAICWSFALCPRMLPNAIGSRWRRVACTAGRGSRGRHPFPAWNQEWRRDADDDRHRRESPGDEVCGCYCCSLLLLKVSLVFSRHDSRFSDITLERSDWRSHHEKLESSWHKKLKQAEEDLSESR